MPAEPLPSLESFPVQSFDKLRYGDTDRQGHVNNAVFATFLESGRTDLLMGADGAVKTPGCSFVLARLEIDYIGEILWPGTVEIGTRVLSVGRSSLRVEQAVFQNGECRARGVSVVVQVHQDTKRGHPWSEAAAAYLASLSAPGLNAAG